MKDLTAAIGILLSVALACFFGFMLYAYYFFSCGQLAVLFPYGQAPMRCITTNK